MYIYTCNTHIVCVCVCVCVCVYHCKIRLWHGTHRSDTEETRLLHEVAALETRRISFTAAKIRVLSHSLSRSLSLALSLSLPPSLPPSGSLLLKSG